MDVTTQQVKLLPGMPESHPVLECWFESQWIHLPANTPGKLRPMAQVLKFQMVFLVLDFGLVQCQLSWPFRE